MRILTTLVLCLSVSLAFADDEVKLKNGDRLSGTVKGLAGGKLIIETPHAGPIKVDWTQVVSVKTDNPVKVKLVTGDLLEGKIVPGGEVQAQDQVRGAVRRSKCRAPRSRRSTSRPRSGTGS